MLFSGSGNRKGIIFFDKVPLSPPKKSLNKRSRVEKSAFCPLSFSPLVFRFLSKTKESVRFDSSSDSSLSESPGALSASIQ